MTIDFMNLPIGSPTRTVTIQNISKEKVKIPSRDKISEKIVFTVSNGDDREFKISDAWVEDNKGARKIQGLWFTTTTDKSGATKLSPASALAKLLRYYKVDTIQDMLKKDVFVHPDNDNFLVLVACDIDENLTERAPLFENN